MIYISIPLHNGINFSIKCIASIKKNDFKDYKIIVCDDGSTDGTLKILKSKFPDVIILKGDGNLWWGGATNKIFKYIKCLASDKDYILMLNNDLIIPSDFLRILKETISDKEMLGVIVKDISNQKIVYAGELLNKITATSINLARNYKKKNNDKWEVDILTGRGVLFPIVLLDEIGFIKSEKMPQYGGDSEFSARAKQQHYKLSVTNKTYLLSHVDNTGNGSIYKKDSLIFFLKSFFMIKSPNYIKSRYYFAKTYTYKFWVFPFLGIQFLRIIGGFIKRKLNK